MRSIVSLFVAVANAANTTVAPVASAESSDVKSDVIFASGELPAHSQVWGEPLGYARGTVNEFGAYDEFGGSRFVAGETFAVDAVYSDSGYSNFF